ncbi:helix-turn-helix domain-containing protein [Streptomyces sp. NPDC004008]
MSTRSPASTGAERQGVAEDLAELYHAGYSIRAIAARTYRSYAGVHKLLVLAGVKFRPRGGNHTRST